MKFRTQASSIFFFAFIVPVFGILAYSGSFNLGVMAGGPVSPPVTSPVTPPGTSPSPTPAPVTPPTYPTPTPTPSPSPMPSVTPFPSPSPRPSASPTPYPSPVPTPSPTPTPTPPPVCKVVQGTVTLFKIQRNGKQARLYFTAASNVTEYKISYGYKAGEVLFIKIAKPMNKNSGIQSVVINNLIANKPYAFQVTPTNNCSEGTPSNWLLATGKVTVKR